MKIIEKIRVKSSVDLLYAKTILKNLKPKRLDILEHVLMELGVNLYKHSIGGEIWIVKNDDKFGIIALDKGEGIKDINWALKKGTSTKNTLGIGLSSVKNLVSDYDLLIFSSTNSIYHGTIIAYLPKINLNKLYLTIPFSGENGDFFAKKGKYIFFGDVSGHGLKANNWAKKFIRYFYNSTISCVISYEFFKSLHEIIKKEKGRGFVGTLIELDKNKYRFCGLGNIILFEKGADFLKKYYFPSAIVGESLRKIKMFEIEKKDNTLILVSDGICEKIAYNILNNLDLKDIRLVAVTLLWFAGLNDDKSVLILK